MNRLPMEDTPINFSNFHPAPGRRPSFVEYLDETTEKVHEGKDFLWCHKSMRIKPLTLRRWQVIIVYERDAVSELYVSSGIVAP